MSCDATAFYLVTSLLDGSPPRLSSTDFRRVCSWTYNAWIDMYNHWPYCLIPIFSLESADQILRNESLNNANNTNNDNIP